MLDEILVQVQAALAIIGGWRWETCRAFDPESGNKRRTGWLQGPDDGDQRMQLGQIDDIVSKY
jgi:hypothetical protein